MTTPVTFLHEIVASFSEGAAGNPTVAMVEAAFAHHGLPWRYVNLEVPVAGLADAVNGARAMGFRGFNCSLPHKVSVIPLLDGLGESAALMGAVNCVVRRGDQLIGENTDGKGFLKSLEATWSPQGKSVVIFGAGGAARAVAVELALAGVSRITVVNRSPARGHELVSLLQERMGLESSLADASSDFVVSESTDLIVNATSIGLYDPQARIPLDITSLSPHQRVADVVFNPVETRLLREAAARGCPTLDGLGMLVNQGVIGIEYWTGMTPDATVMRRALEAAMGR